MKEQQFEKWLKDYGFNPHVVSSRLSNVKRIEEYYSNLDQRINENTINSVLELLTYGAKAEKAGLPAAHCIPINGNIRNGTATLKSALNLYCQFYQETYGVEVPAISEFEKLFIRIKKLLSNFTDANPKRKDFRGKVKTELQVPILELLKKEMPEVEWEMEYVIGNNSNDRVDIYGKPKGLPKACIIIELDTTRSDQVSKKFVSRMALTEGYDTIFISFCYPNTNSNSKSGKSECGKYSSFIQTLNDALAKGSDNEKYYAYISLR